jgi:predicted membrane-bound spermidine synthase
MNEDRSVRQKEGRIKHREKSKAAGNPDPKPLIHGNKLDRRRILLFFSLFALSGFSGLIYESVWTSYLSLFLGHAAYAQILVLAIYMGGMAAGSWICSTFCFRWKNLLLGYSLAEGTIGLLALAFHSAFVGLLDFSYSTVIPYLGSPMLIEAFKWSLSGLIVLPQAILLGMTFPLMNCGIIRRFPERPGRSIAILYFANSIGAAIGVLTSGFLLVKLFGLPGTVRIAGLINILLALAVWTVVRRSAEERPPARVRYGAVQEHPSAASYRLLLLASMLTGAASFMYEVGWIRMLSLVLGASTHAFELMLSAFIFGLAFGGLWIQRRIDALPSPVRFLGQVQVVMGLLALSTLATYGTTFDVIQWILGNLDKTELGYTLFNFSRSAVAMAVMLPATFCAGMTLPLITFILIKQRQGERSIGAVYGANTIGAILGVFLAIDVAIPSVGVKGLIAFGAALDMALGLIILWHRRVKSGSNRMKAAYTGVAVAAILVTILFVHLDPYKMGSGVYRYGQLLSNEDRVLYHRDGQTATVSCFLSEEGELSIRTNGKSDASVMVGSGAEHSYDETTMTLLAVLPMTFRPLARTAGVIGFGSGYTSHVLLADPALARVDTIEIERNMVEAAQNFRPLVDRVFTDSRSHIYYGDAKTFLSTGKKRYDMIVSEPSNPWVSGIAGLFSREFYHQVREHLDDDGLLVQWVQLYETNVDLVFSILKAVSENFEDYVVYKTYDLDAIIIAKKKGALGRPDYSVMKVPAVRDALRRIHIQNEHDISIREIGSKQLFERLLEASSVPANSDYYPFLDQNAERARFLQLTALDFAYFTRYPLPVLEMLQSSGARVDSAEITPCARYSESGRYRAAMWLRDRLVGGNADSGSGQGDLAQKALKLKQYRQGDPSLGGEERMAIFFGLLGEMFPYLTTADFDRLWKSLDTGAFAQAESPSERQWLGLIRAIGERDAGGMLEHARDLLANQPNLDPLAQSYLLSCGLLGAVAEGNRAEARGLLSRYGYLTSLNNDELTLGSRQIGLLLRLLVADINVN